MKHQRHSWAVVVPLLLAAGCGQAATPGGAATPTGEAGGFTLTSPDVTADGSVPTWAVGSFAGYCDGENRSIALHWSGAPTETVAFAVSMIDATYVHWVVMDIPATASGLAATPDGAVSEGVVGTSIAGGGGYVGPCVEGHEYVYTVYALDTTVGGTEQTSWSAAEALMAGHVLASASLGTRRPADA